MLITLTMDSFAQSPPPPGTRVDRDLIFAKFGDKNLSLDLYRPAKQAGKLPVVVWIYGGAWMQRNKSAQVGHGSWLATHGYAVAVIDYRLSSEALFPAQINDCKAAVRWLRANAAKYGLDGEHVGAWGESSGGHLASMLGVTGDRSVLGAQGDSSESSSVQAVVDFYGPTDFLQMDAHALPNSPFKHDAPDSPESRLVGGPIQQNASRVEAANPVKYVARNAPPFLIVHGEQDPLVPCHQSELLYEALKKEGAGVTFYKIAGAGHGGPEFYNEMMRGAVLAFLDRHLKP
ncbi:MAG TPA: alpha/beta hydrolase [Terriglobales bacterium]|nr:alpha/beta hydrolase [Terriglobales bacterium]